MDRNKSANADRQEPRREFDRDIKKAIMSALKRFECVVLTGPRQIGKSTLAYRIMESYSEAIYRDLDDPRQREEVGDGVEFFKQHANSLVVLDEIQRCPHLFPSLKSHIDRQRRLNHRSEGGFLLLGSASLDILENAAASLTGRYKEIQMTGLLPTEIRSQLGEAAEHERYGITEPIDVIDQAFSDQFRTLREGIELLWCRGGQPNSFLAETNEHSLDYRQNFITNYMHRDVAALGLNIDGRMLERCFRFLASMKGSLFNDQTFANSLGAKPDKINESINALHRLLLVRILEPWSENIKPRVSNRPMIYVRDSGLLHSMLELDNVAQVLSSNHRGKSWEGFVIESIIGAAINAGNFRGGYFFRTHDGDSELDFVLDRGRGVKWGFEIKCSDTPKVTERNTRAAELVGVERRFLVHTGEEKFTTQQGGFECLPLIETLAIVSEE